VQGLKGVIFRLTMTGSPPPRPPSPGPRARAQKPSNCHGLRKIIYFFLYILGNFQRYTGATDDARTTAA
jgi:hypothetical protein